ncbi:MAG: citrate synthase [Pirellulales bacterium]|nr:citrate synthase [Pirellulales bacterium]
MAEEIYSPGLEGVIAGETAISTIAGGLQYRGYSVESLADHCSFEEVAFLVLEGELPQANQLAAFRDQLNDAMFINSEIVETLGKLPESSSMMDVMRTGVSMLAHWDPETGDNSHEANLRKSIRLLAQLPVVMAARERLRKGKKPIEPDAELSLAGNVLWQLFGEKPTESFARAMDVSLILYAEHEYNASTFTSRVVASTLSDLHSAIAAAIGALKGPLHGGANERVLEVLQEVGSSERAAKWVREALDNKRRIMGFGHRVYKTGDPRAVYLKTLCAELAVGRSEFEDMEQIAETIEQAVTSEKGLPPNLDWPSARLYHYMDIPVDLYTPLFVVSRVVGWSAHVIEQHDNNRLIRPRARYNGKSERTWLPISER